MGSNIRERPELNEIQISKLEIAIINWISPFEYPIFWLFKPLLGDGIKNNPYMERGTWRALVDHKADAYKRLIHSAEIHDGIDRRVLGVYNGEICGRVMIATYYIFQRR